MVGRGRKLPLLGGSMKKILILMLPVFTACSPLVLETVGEEIVKDLVIISTERDRIHEAIKKDKPENVSETAKNPDIGNSVE